MPCTFMEIPQYVVVDVVIVIFRFSAILIAIFHFSKNFRVVFRFLTRETKVERKIQYKKSFLAHAKRHFFSGGDWNQAGTCSYWNNGVSSFIDQENYSCYFVISANENITIRDRSRSGDFFLRETTWGTWCVWLMRHRDWLALESLPPLLYVKRI